MHIDRCGLLEGARFIASQNCDERPEGSTIELLVIHNISLPPGEFGGPGIVDKGIIRPLPRSQTAEELGQNILICEKNEMIDRLAHYAEIGIDEVIVTSIFGQDQRATLDMMSAFSAEVMPHLKPLKRKI